METNCPHCGQYLVVKPAFYGTIAPCPNCAADFSLPNPEPPAGAPTAGDDLDPRIAELKSRFEGEGFRVDDAAHTEDFPFLYSASKVRFDFVGVPTFLEEFFIFQSFAELDMPAFREFMDSASAWAIANENPMPKSAELSKAALKLVLKLGGPEGRVAASSLDRLSVRQTTCLVYVYAVAVAESVTPDTMEWLWSKQSAAARKDRTQATFVVPVVYDTATWQIEHFKKRPLLGNVYYTEARKVIKKRLVE